MKRGDVVTIAARGHYSGKPRPALIIQSDLFAQTASVTVCLFSTVSTDAPLLRLDIEPTADNGLRRVSQLMIDKVTTVPRDQIGAGIGALDDAAMVRVDRSLALFLGIVKPPVKRAQSAKRSSK